STLACGCFFLFFTESASIEIYTLSLHDALPICVGWEVADPVSFCFIEVKPDLSGGAVEPRMKRSVSGVCKLRKGLVGCIQRIDVVYTVIMHFKNDTAIGILRTLKLLELALQQRSVDTGGDIQLHDRCAGAGNRGSDHLVSASIKRGCL